MTEPVESTAGARRTGTVACGVGAVALLAAAVVFWAGGRPYGRTSAAGRSTRSACSPV